MLAGAVRMTSKTKSNSERNGINKEQCLGSVINRAITSNSQWPDKVSGSGEGAQFCFTCFGVRERMGGVFVVEVHVLLCYKEPLRS